MYKTELQELCHKRKWGLPRYSAIKDGPDHMPSFNASVYVNGVTFTSSGSLSSLKEAQNQAAMLAFLSFTSESSPTAAHDTNEQIGTLKPLDILIPDQYDMDHSCKNQIQNNLVPHVLTCKIENLSLATHFRDTVKVNEQSLNNTLEEKGTAKLSLMSLSSDIFEKGDSDSFKTSLLKLTEREGFGEPTYKIMHAGSPCMPTFFSTVVVDGLEFHGKGSISKKQAEEDAAKIAYIALKECGLSMYPIFSPSHQ